MLKEKQFWTRLTTETSLVFMGIALLTLIVCFLPFSSRASNGLLLYLLAILIFASLFGIYAALLAACVAFFTFDYFFVPPLYGFQARVFGDLLHFSLFLIIAIIIGRLTSFLCSYALQSRQRAYEAQILDEFMRATMYEGDIEQPLKIFVNSVVHVFSSEGIHDCMLLLPDLSGVLRSFKSAYQLLDRLSFFPGEEAATTWILSSAHAVDIYDPLLTRIGRDGIFALEQKSWWVRKRKGQWLIRLLPLKTETRIFGVLRLLIEERKPGPGKVLGLEQPAPSTQSAFFSTFLEQAATVIEQRLYERSIDNLDE